MKKKNKVKLLYALNKKEELVSAYVASRKEKYFCPVCKGEVILKRGKIKIAHFAHKQDSNCNNETVVHLTAKLLLKEIIKDKTLSPYIKKRCAGCEFKRVIRYIPSTFNNASLEFKVESGHIVDVAVLDNGKVKFAIEVYVHHKVEESKLYNLSLPFIEVKGNDVLENPLEWKVLNDNLKPLFCKDCQNKYENFKEKAIYLAQKLGVQLPERYYRYAIHRCWRCKREILVFAWPYDDKDDFFHRPKIYPLPDFVKYRYSKTVQHKYWGNVCPFCNSLQGDFFLYHQFSGPFFGIPLLEDNERGYLIDMVKIALHAKELGYF